MSFSLIPQEFGNVRTEDGRSVRLLRRDNAYIRIGVGGESVQLQGGQVYGTGGDRLPKEKWPGWLLDEIAKCSPQQLIAVGWLKPKPTPPADPFAAAQQALAMLAPEERETLLAGMSVADETDSDDDDHDTNPDSDPDTTETETAIVDPLTG